MSLLADEDADRRSTEEAPLLNVPARLSKHRMSRRRQPREVAHLSTGYEADGGAPREAEELDHPSSADILGDTGRGRGGVDRRVLIPGRCQPVRRQRRRHAAADHEAEVAGAGRCDEAAIHAPCELLDDRLGIFARVGQRQVERRPQLLRRSAWTDVPVLQVREVVPRDRDGAVEQARVASAQPTICQAGYVDLLAPDVTRIAPAGSEPAKDRAPDELASGTPEPLRSELIDLLGEDRVLTRVIDLVRYASDASPYRLLPKAVLMARDADDVAKVLAYGRRTGTPVTFRAGGRA